MFGVLELLFIFCEDESSESTAWVDLRFPQYVRQMGNQMMVWEPMSTREATTRNTIELTRLSVPRLVEPQTDWLV